MKRFNTSNHDATNRDGTTSVEFALVFPITLAFFMGMIGMTQMFLLKDTAQHAAYEGARNALVITSDRTDVENAVSDFTRIMGVDGAVVTVDPATIDTTVREVTVSVTIPMNENAWISASFIPASWTVTSEVTLARQHDQ